MLLALWNLWRFSWPNTWLSGEYLMCTLRMLILLLDLWKVLYMGFPCGSAGKESACSSGDLGLIPRLGRSPGEGKGYPLQYSDLEKSMDCIVSGVSKRGTRLSDFYFQWACRNVSPSTRGQKGTLWLDRGLWTSTLIFFLIYFFIEG